MSGKILKILNYIGTALGIIIILAGVINYATGVENKAQAANDSVVEIKNQREADRKEWIEQFNKVVQSASAAESDAAATRKYTEFIVNRLGGRPSDILHGVATSTNE